MNTPHPKSHEDSYPSTASVGHQSSKITLNHSAHDELGDDINPKKLLLQTLGTLVVLGVILTIISTTFREPVEAWSQTFIEHTGFWGVGLGFMLPDALTLPIPPDAFLMAGYMGGLDFYSIALSASIGSIVGGTLGFLMIRKVTFL